MSVGGRRLKSVLRDGDIAGFYFIWYGLGRTWVELLFRPDAWTIGSLPTAAWIGLAMVVIGLAIIIVGHARPRTQADVWEIDKQMTN
jgi:phosphatidylglycerol:prolipoprotein diacylglycerol transferase